MIDITEQLTLGDTLRFATAEDGIAYLNLPRKRWGDNDTDEEKAIKSKVIPRFIKFGDDLCSNPAWKDAAYEIRIVAQIGDSVNYTTSKGVCEP